MKNLWVARLARPDIQKAIGHLASRIQCWSRNDDKRLHRMVCYLDSSAHYMLTGKVNDPPELLKLLLFVDADFSGDSDSAKSTSGGMLILAGPNTWLLDLTEANFKFQVNY